MEMDRLKDAKQEDRVCVGAQRLLRLQRKLWDFSIESAWMDPDERHNRLTAFCSEVRALITEASPCGHAEHLADEPATIRRVERIKQAINAAIVDWYNG
jgi:hypothetical protein